MNMSVVLELVLLFLKVYTLIQSKISQQEAIVPKNIPMDIHQHFINISLPAA